MCIRDSNRIALAKVDVPCAWVALLVVGFYGATNADNVTTGSIILVEGVEAECVFARLLVDHSYCAEQRLAIARKFLALR